VNHNKKEHAMSEQTGEHLEEEPQEERGPKGSRDEKADSSGGPERPSGTGDEGDDTGVKPDKSDHPNAPDLQSGGN